MAADMSDPADASHNIDVFPYPTLVKPLRSAISAAVQTDLVRSCGPYFLPSLFPKFTFSDVVTSVMKYVTRKVGSRRSELTSSPAPTSTNPDPFHQLAQLCEARDVASSRWLSAVKSAARVAYDHVLVRDAATRRKMLDVLIRSTLAPRVSPSLHPLSLTPSHPATEREVIDGSATRGAATPAALRVPTFQRLSSDEAREYSFASDYASVKLPLTYPSPEEVRRLTYTIRRSQTYEALVRGVHDAMVSVVEKVPLSKLVSSKTYACDADTGAQLTSSAVRAAAQKGRSVAQLTWLQRIARYTSHRLEKKMTAGLKDAFEAAATAEAEAEAARKVEKVAAAAEAEAAARADAAAAAAEAATAAIEADQRQQAVKQREEEAAAAAAAVIAAEVAAAKEPLALPMQLLCAVQWKS